ncbi:thermonuclease family protein [Actinotalea solisilvae]|uniref:thermonuclease family protein n=1 Tax=Actinotalea solisilvae TaxID=2072922 RepID=UPI0018F25FF6|nr:thermonuclease family protein [Actinotalea solisilvae]
MSRRRRRGGLVPVLLVLAALVVLGVARESWLREALGLPEAGTPSVTVPRAEPAVVEGPFAVVRVVDGDTLVILRPEGETKVRVLGIDTAETVDPRRPVQCFGPEASARATELLAGTQVTVRGDPLQDRVDRYGRELDYVWLPDGLLFNQVMVEEGFAVEATFDGPYEMQTVLRDAQDRAAAAGLGLWSPATCGGDITQPVG